METTRELNRRLADKIVKTMEKEKTDFDIAKEAHDKVAEAIYDNGVSLTAEMLEENARNKEKTLSEKELDNSELHSGALGLFDKEDVKLAVKGLEEDANCILQNIPSDTFNNFMDCFKKRFGEELT